MCKKIPCTIPALLLLVFLSAFILADTWTQTLTSDFTGSSLTDTQAVSDSVILAETSMSDNWWNTSWAYRRTVTIDNKTSSALSDYQIKITNPIYDETGLVGNWHFSEGTYATAADSSGSSNMGAMNGSSYWNSSGKYGPAFAGNGSANYANCGNSTSLNFGTGNFTITAWVSTTDITTNDWKGIVGKWSAGSAGYFLQYYPSTSAWAFGWNGSTFLNPVKNIGDGNWHFIAAKRTSTTSAELWIDGNFIASNLALPSGSSDTTEALNIGRLSASVGRYLNGSIDEVRIYNRAISTVEILALYEAKAKLNYDDVRFVNSAGAELPSWMEKDGTFWVKVSGTNSLPVGLTAIYMYYGNPSAANTASYPNTFPEIFGSGNGGPLSVTSGSFNVNSQTNGYGGRTQADAVNFSTTGTISAGATTVTLSSTPTGLATGDEILIINLQGSTGDNGNVGNYETRKITGIASNTLTLEAALTKTFGDSSTQKIMVQRIPHYTNVTVSAGATLTASAYDGTRNGVLFFRASGTVTIEGTVDMKGKGYRGGNVGGTKEAYSSGYTPYAGESYHRGVYQPVYNTNHLGGGSGGITSNGEGMNGGYGGGYGTGGSNGVTACNVLTAYGGAGLTYGTSYLGTVFLGSGGGEGSNYYYGGGQIQPSGYGSGGNGGGIIYIAAPTISNTNSITAKGSDGQNGYLRAQTSSDIAGGGGGGGAGGSICLLGNTITTGTADATGGTGGTATATTYGSWSLAPVGGAGGSGRIRIDCYGTLNGSTNPSGFNAQNSPAMARKYAAPEPLVSTYAEQENIKFSYQKSITLNNTSGSVLTNHQIKITVGYSAGGDFNLGSACRTDFADIRFGDSTGKTYPYWRESFTTSGTAVFWIKVPSIATGTGTVIYIYYGNQAAGGAYNGDAVFEFFDDFNGALLDTDTKWTVNTGDQSVANGEVTLGSSGSTYVRSQQTFPVDRIVRAKVKVISAGTADSGYVGFADGTGRPVASVSNNVVTAFTYTSLTAGYFDTAISTTLYTETGMTYTDRSTYRTDEVHRISTTSAKIYQDGTLKNTSSTNIPAGNLPVVIGRLNTGAVKYDFVAVRKYASTETAVSTTGSASAWNAAAGAWTKGGTLKVTNSTANALTNYQALFTIDTAALVSSGFLNRDCSDLRFASTVDYSESRWTANYPYWIESGANTATTKIWVKVDYIPASSYKNVYIYYGNPGAPARSDWSNTFAASGTHVQEITPDTNTKGLWHMNNSWADSATGGTTGTANGGATFTTNARLGSYAGLLDGTDDYVTMGDPVSGSLDFGTGDFTWECWVYVNKTTPASNEWPILAKTGPNTARDNGFEIEISSWSGLGIGAYVTIGAASYEGAPGCGNINAGQWYHVLYLRSGTTIKAYLDGVLKGSKTHANFGTNISNAKEFRFGENTWGNGLPGCYLDEVCVSNIPLTYSEIMRRAGVRNYVSPEPVTSITGIDTLPPVYKTSGTMVSPAITPAKLYQWGTLSFTKSDASGGGPAGTTVTIDVLKVSDGSTLAADVASDTDLNTITAVKNETSIRLRANFSTTDQLSTPSLSDWSLVYTIDTTAPAPVPDSPILTAVSANQVNLSWTAATDTQSGLAGYKINRAPDSGGSPGTYVQVGTALTNSWTDNTTNNPSYPLQSNTKYYYTITAYDNFNNETTGIYSGTYTLADPPVSAAASSGFSSYVTVSWQSGGSEDHFHVYRNGVSGAGTIVYNSSATSFNDNIGTTGTQTYYIYAVNPDNAESSSYITASGAIDITAPAIVTLLSPSQNELISDNTPLMDWSDATDLTGILNYELEISASSGFSSAVYSASPSVSASAVSTTIPSGTYYWRVRSTDGAGNISNWSETGKFVIFGEDAALMKSDAGDDITSNPGVIALDGSGSTNIDGTASGLTYEWTLLSYPNSSTPELLNPATSQPSFIATASGAYSFSLTVSNSSLSAIPDVVVVTINNLPPTADSGEDRMLFNGPNIYLDGAKSSDPNEETLTYNWEQLSGVSVALYDADTAEPYFSSANLTGNMEFKLTVTDSAGQTATDTVLLAFSSTTNSAPSANAGPDQVVEAGAAVTLYGNSSFDPDGDTMKYSWTQVSGPYDVTLQNASTALPSATVPSPGVYVFKLEVSDTKTYSLADYVNIIVNDTTNSLPRAQIEMILPSDGEPVRGEIIILSGNSSVDADGDTLTYVWTQTGGPSLTLTDTTTQTIALTPAQSGRYKFMLSVNDDTADGIPAEMEIWVKDNTAVEMPSASAELPSFYDPEGDFRIFSGGNSPVVIDATGSTGEGLVYKWTQISGPAVNLLDVTQTDAETGEITVIEGKKTFTPKESNLYGFILTVTDSNGMESKSELYFAVDTPENGLPDADAGDNATYGLGDTAYLDGSTSSDPIWDPDGLSAGSELTYYWTQTSGPPVVLYNADSSKPYFYAASYSEYKFTLQVSDGLGLSLTDEVTITVQGIGTGGGTPTGDTVIPVVDNGTTIITDNSAEDTSGNDTLEKLLKHDDTATAKGCFIKRLRLGK